MIEEALLKTETEYKETREMIEACKLTNRIHDNYLLTKKLKKLEFTYKNLLSIKEELCSYDTMTLTPLIAEMLSRYNGESYGFEELNWIHIYQSASSFSGIDSAEKSAIMFVGPIATVESLKFNEYAWYKKDSSGYLNNRFKSAVDAVKMINKTEGCLAIGYVKNRENSARGNYPSIPLFEIDKDGKQKELKMVFDRLTDAQMADVIPYSDREISKAFTDTAYDVYRSETLTKILRMQMNK